MEAWEKMGPANTTRATETGAEANTDRGRADTDRDEEEGTEEEEGDTPQGPQTPAMASTRPSSAVGATSAAARPAVPPIARRRLPKREDGESPSEEFTRLMGHSAVAAQEGALASSRALMAMANETASARLKESEALANKLLTESEALAKRQLAEADASSKRLLADTEVITSRQLAEAQASAKRMLAEAESLTSRQFAEAESSSKRQLAEADAASKRLLAETEEITTKQLAETRETIRRLEEAAKESIAKREATVDEREKSVAAREAELARRELEHQDKVMGEHLALLDLRRKTEEELKPLRDAIIGDYDRHSAEFAKKVQADRQHLHEQLAAEWKAQHDSMLTERRAQHAALQEQLAAEVRIHREQLAAETKSHREHIELMTAQAKEITTQAKEMASERADYSKKLVDNVDLGAGALLKIAETVQKQADLVGQMSELSASAPPPPKTTGPEVIGNVAISLFDAIKTLGVTALNANPKLAKALEGPLGKGAELAKLGEQAATEAGFVPNTRAEPPSEAPRPESPPPPDPAAVALDLPLAVLNKPEVLQQLQAKFGPDFMRKARLADFVKLAQETPGHAG